MKILFGPAGIPLQCNATTTIDGIKCCNAIGLDAMEIQFGMGVRLNEDDAKDCAKIAVESNIALSSHAPYFVNLCSKEKEKITTSMRNLFEAAKITHVSKGRITVFHPGFYQKLQPNEAFEHAKAHLQELEEKLKQHRINIILGAETVGKRTAFGSLLENIKLSQQLTMVKPVIDFAHLLARGDFIIKNEDDYRNILTFVERELPDYSNNIHCHFSEINYGYKGERNHMALGERNIPPFKPLMKVLAENGYSGTVICESPKLDVDAQKMKTEYARYKVH